MNTSNKGQQAPPITLRTRTSTSSQTPPSTPRGSIGTTWRHRMAHKPQCPSSKRCQSRQPVSISTVVIGSRAHIAGFHREYPTQTTPSSVNPRRSHRIPQQTTHTKPETTLNCPNTTQKTRFARNKLFHNAGLQRFIHMFSARKHAALSPAPHCPL